MVVDGFVYSFFSVDMYVWEKDIIGNINNCKEDFSKVINVLIEQEANKEAHAV